MSVPIVRGRRDGRVVTLFTLVNGSDQDHSRVPHNTIMFAGFEIEKSQQSVFRVDGWAPELEPIVSIGKTNSMTIQIRALNCFKFIFFNGFG